MKTILNTLTNTYKAVRLLSNPNVASYIEHELGRGVRTAAPVADRLGSRDAYFHKHYIVHVVN